MVRSVAVCQELNSKPFLFIPRPNLPFRSGGCESWGGFALTSKTSHRSAPSQSNVWDPNPPVAVLSILRQSLNDVFSVLRFFHIYSLFGTNIAGFLLKECLCNIPWLSKGGSLAAPALTGEHLEAQVNTGTSEGTAHKHMVDIIPKKSSEWKDFIWLTVKSGGLMKHMNDRQNPFPLGAQG